MSRYSIDAMNAINNCYTNYDPIYAPNGIHMGKRDGSHSIYTQDISGNVQRTTFTPNWQLEHFSQQAKRNFAPTTIVTEPVAFVATNTNVSALLCLRCNKRGHLKDACVCLVHTPKACCACKSTATFHNEKECIAKNTCKHCGTVDDKHKADEDKCINNPKNKCAFCGIIDYAHDQIQCGVGKQTNMIVPVSRKPVNVNETMVVKRTAESKAKNPNSVGDEYVVEGDKVHLYEKGKYVMSFSLEYLFQHLNVQPPTINVNPFANQPPLPPTNDAKETPIPNKVAPFTKVEVVDDDDVIETEKDDGFDAWFEKAKIRKAEKEKAKAKVREDQRFKSILKKTDASAKPASTTYSFTAPEIIDDDAEDVAVKKNTKKNERISPTGSFDGYGDDIDV